MAVEEGQQQGADVRAVDVRVGHDDDAVVAQVLRLHVVAADAAAQRRDQIADFLRGQHLLQPRLLDVEDLALQRQDRLEAAVAALLGRAAGGVALDQEDLGLRRVLLLAIGQLARQAGDIQHALAPVQLLGLARGFTGAGGVHHLGADHLGFARALQQEFLELLHDQLLDRHLDLGGDQLFLGLRGELGVAHFHRQHRDQAFARIVADRLDLFPLRHALAFEVIVHGAGQRVAEPGEMGAAILLRDVVGKAEHPFLVGIVPLQRRFDADAVLLRIDVDDGLVQRCLVLVEVLDEGADAAVVLVHILAGGGFLAQHDAHAGIEEGQLAQAARQDVVVEFGLGEDLVAGIEAHHGAALAGLALLRQRRLGLAHAVFLVVVAAVAVDVEQQQLGQRIHHRHADTVQAAGNLVTAAAELTAGMQDGHDHFRRRATLFLHDVDRDAAAVVHHRDAVVGVENHLHLGAIAGQGFVDGVVHHLEHHVVQAGAVIGVADVHARSLTDRVQALEDLDAAGVVAGVVAWGSVHRLVLF